MKLIIHLNLKSFLARQNTVRVKEKAIMTVITLKLYIGAIDAALMADIWISNPYSFGTANLNQKMQSVI